MRSFMGGTLVPRIVTLWGVALVIGVVFAIVVLRDMGSVAAWFPAILAGLFLWIVRPDDAGNRREEFSRTRAQVLLIISGGLVLLGILDVMALVVERLPFDELERPRQRFELARDISYILPGEWIAQVRWLASRFEEGATWVPNMNSDIAIFGVAAHYGVYYAVLSSLLLIAIAAGVALAGEQVLREAHAITESKNRVYSVAMRWLGLALYMFAVLLVMQWLIHLATGVVLHLPITGLVFPWISHGNTTHLLYTLILALPLALAAVFNNVSIDKMKVRR